MKVMDMVYKGLILTGALQLTARIAIVMFLHHKEPSDWLLHTWSFLIVLFYLTNLKNDK